MRLKEPLQGVKMGIGHLLSHWILWIVATFFVNTNPVFIDKSTTATEVAADYVELLSSTDTELTEDSWPHELNAFHLLRRGHLGMGILLLVYLVLKRWEYRNLSQLMISIGSPVFQFYPMMNAIFVYNLDDLNDFIIKSSVRTWILIEILYFFTFLVSCACFVFFAYMRKYKSLQKRKYDENIAICEQEQVSMKEKIDRMTGMEEEKAQEELDKADNKNNVGGLLNLNYLKENLLGGLEIEEKERDHNDVWNAKQNDDFLRYLKWEAFNFSFYFTHLLMGNIVFVYFQNYYEYYTYAGAPYNRNFIIVQVLLNVMRVVNLRVFQLQLKRGHIFEYNFQTRENRRKMIALFTIIVTFVVVLVMLHNVDGLTFDIEGNDFSLLRNWIFIELTAVILEPIYFYFLHKIINLLPRADQYIWDVSHSESNENIQIQKIGEPVRTSLNSEIEQTVAQSALAAIGKRLESLVEKNKYQKMVEKLSDKHHVELEHDFYSLTVLCYLKENRERMLLTTSKQALQFHNVLTILSVQLTMLVCMLLAIIINEDGEYDNAFAHSKLVLLVKLPCAIALHLYLYPEVQKGMIIMKFANNQPELFVANGSQISFFIGFMQYWASLLAEAINIYLLAYQHTVDHCIIHFVALEVIMEMSKLYLEALPDENIKEVLHHHVAIKNRGRDIKFAKRSGFHKFARVLYKVMRALYVAVIFYFIPYTVWFLNFWLAEVGVHSDKSH